MVTWPGSQPPRTAGSRRERSGTKRSSVILLGVNYSRLGDPLAILQQRSRGAISIYAQGADYHEVIKAKLKPLAARVQALLGGEVKIFVDTAPVMEKPLAARSRARLAGQAHQSRLARVRLMAVHRLDLHQRRDRARRSPSRIIAGPAGAASISARPAPSPQPIGSMRARASHTSPSSTRDTSRRVSARRWATASSAATIASPSARGTNSRKARARRSSRSREASDNPPLAELLLLDDAAFRARFRGTPIKRTGRDRFLRNVLIAVGNSGGRDARPLGGGTARGRFAAGTRHGGMGVVAFRRRQRFRRAARTRTPPTPIPPSRRVDGMRRREPAIRLRPRLLRPGPWRRGLPHAASRSPAPRATKPISPGSGGAATK